MCGILAVIGKRDKELVQRLSKRMSHRGPDESGIYVDPKGSILTHERLSIIDLTTGRQPIHGTSTAWVVHNGEIYNHQEIRNGILKHHTFHTTCDSEVIVHLYEEFGYDFCNYLDGDFAFAVVDGDRFVVGRDPIGVKPLYWGKDEDGNLWFSSEMKTLADQCVEYDQFPPGFFYSPETGLKKWYNPQWQDVSVPTKSVDYTKLRDSLIEATRKRLMSDVPLAVLLSGGLDSSLISAITMRLIKESGQELHSFSVGLNADAPDLKYARQVAEFIGTKHHEIYFSVEQGIKDIEKIIWHLETYDVTTIRASTPMYYLSKAVVENGFKVVLSGEGSDEIFGGYLYFHNAPSTPEFHAETIRRVGLLYSADCLRADKSTMAHGLEARVPFLDKDFLAEAMSIDAADKRPDRSMGKPEKYILRKAFEDKDNPLIPDSILWRQKEQFGDGVGYNWIDGIIAHANKSVSDEDFAKAAELFPHNTPVTKEAFFYRRIFEKFYPQEPAVKSVLKWIPRWQKNTDPSGRVCDNHEKKEDDLKHAAKTKEVLTM